MTMVESDIKIKTSDPDAEESDDGFSHIVRKDDVARGYVEGVPIKALCGRVFVPSKDPESLPTCAICLRAHSQLGRSSAN